MGRRVEQVRYCERTCTWRVNSRSTVNDDTTTTEQEDEFDKLIVSNGHYAKPSDGGFGSEASIRERFRGHVLHSHNYRKPDIFKRGERVVIVGAAASALDIGVELAQYGCEVVLAHRGANVSSKSKQKFFV